MLSLGIKEKLIKLSCCHYWLVRARLKASIASNIFLEHLDQLLLKHEISKNKPEFSELEGFILIAVETFEDVFQLADLNVNIHLFQNPNNFLCVQFFATVLIGLSKEGLRLNVYMTPLGYIKKIVKKSFNNFSSEEQ